MAWNTSACTAPGDSYHTTGVIGIARVRNQTGNCGVGCSGFDWASDYWIGTGGNCRFNAGSFSGTIDEVALFKSALKASEVKTLYNLTK